MERARLIELLRATGCAEETGGYVFLRDPRWSEAERAQAAALRAEIGVGRSETDAGWLCIPTGGSSGTIKFARHDERTLGAAARGFSEYFGFTRVNAVDVLPPWHVSGLMARVRSHLSGGTHVAWDWRRLDAGERPELGQGDWVLSLVPTQLQRLLESLAAVDWLRRFRVIFLGGGPVWKELADAAATARLPISLSYGMTETAAMVAALTPEEFLAGQRSSGRALPHARISLTAEGLIRIEGESVFRGYFPRASESRRFVTEDLGMIETGGFLRVLGRRDAVIISGGEKVQPAEVEAALRATGEFGDVAVIGAPDLAWGERVIACFPAETKRPDMERVRASVRETLAAYKRPKDYVAITEWPRNAQGKLNRAELRRRVAAVLGGSAARGTDDSSVHRR
jgi:O-succinylbenzoic acid--CoA ligase